MSFEFLMVVVIFTKDPFYRYQWKLWNKEMPQKHYAIGSK